MDVVLAALIGVMSALLGSVLGVLVQGHTMRKDQLRATAAEMNACHARGVAADHAFLAAAAI